MAKIEHDNRPVSFVMQTFASETISALKANFHTQKVWPDEIYPGFAKVNEKRSGTGKWFATGQGAKSFASRVISSPGNESIGVSFNDYLRYVDMGVGKGRKWEDVDSSRRARYSKRYVAMWFAADGKTHRPAIMMEMRHLQGRMQRYFEDFYGYETEVQLYKTFENLSPLNLNL